MSALQNTPAVRLRRLDLADALAGDPIASAERLALVRRGAVPDPAVRDAVRAILADVRRRGDVAVAEANARVGGGTTDGTLVIGPETLRDAAAALDLAVREALETAIANVTAFAAPQRPVGSHVRIADGVDLERRWTPLASVGAYVPGGSAPPFAAASDPNG